MSKTALFSRSSYHALCAAAVALLLAGTGCKGLMHKLGFSDEALGGDGGVDLAGVPSLSVSPSSQSVIFGQDGGWNPNSNFCTQHVVYLTATITNNTANAFYVSATGIGNTSLGSFSYNGTALSSTSVNISAGMPIESVQFGAMQLVEPSGHVDFRVGICPANSDGTFALYPYSGTGAYTFTVTYHYTGPDYVPTDGGDVDAGDNAPTLHDTLTSSLVTVNAT
jgi:hypothetical protein